MLVHLINLMQSILFYCTHYCLLFLFKMVISDMDFAMKKLSKIISSSVIAQWWKKYSLLARCHRWFFLYLLTFHFSTLTDRPNRPSSLSFFRSFFVGYVCVCVCVCVYLCVICPFPPRRRQSISLGANKLEKGRERKKRREEAKKKERKATHPSATS